MFYVDGEYVMEINYDRKTGHEIVKHYWKDSLRKDWVISNKSLEGKAGAPLNPQEWIEHYYRSEGAIDFFEEI